LLGFLVIEEAQAQDFAAQRARMVEEIEATYAETRAFTGLAAMSPRVRAALGKVERHRLVPPEQRALAYRNHPLPIGHGQTISQPYIVALSTDLIAPQPHHKVLEVGTGSGYQAAVLAELVQKVYSIEILNSLALAARDDLARLQYQNIEIKVGDGYQGWPEKAPFDAIVVTAAAPRVPDALVAQLKPGGKMVIPVGATGETQELLLLVKTAAGGVEQKGILPVRFVPLLPSIPPVPGR
jgi:protein-L-isoaspartate(D-aspartate) O-methyltransferase